MRAVYVKPALALRGPASAGSMGLAVVELSCLQSPVAGERVALGPPCDIHFSRTGQP